MNDFIFYFKIGLFHVLDLKGYDHILFLVVLAVIYQLKQWKKVLWLITLFTIGHTITLTLATYRVLNVKSDLVEFLIPLTIFITGLVNILTFKKIAVKRKKSPNLFFALFFGLIHGLGFSNYFRIIIDKSNDKLIHLSEFALGIEAAQTIIVLSILLIGSSLQVLTGVSKRDWVMVTSSVVIGFSLQMIFNRIFW